MRIVVSGTHASGKSTLISDFALRHPGFTVLPDPFELLDEASDAPGAAMLSLGELIDDPDIVPAGVRVVEITGDPRTRRELLEQAL
ncbi:hypothetical protein [Microbacterium sp.]|uniref:hypothetical protein n=1 Tax=Microbacterium sp. TaxID=51671 RepID=UPI003A8E3E52